MKEFKIIPENSHSYVYACGDHATTDIVWMSEKPWFTAGQEVVIQDKQTGEIKLYKKES